MKAQHIVLEPDEGILIDQKASRQKQNPSLAQSLLNRWMRET